MTFGERLRTRRNELGLTQQQVADCIGVTKGAISGLENGNSKTSSSDNLIPLANALRVHPEWLTTGKLPDVMLSATQQRIAKAMKALNMHSFDLTDACDGRVAWETVDMWLRAAADPTDAQLEMIARPLGRTFDWLKSGVAVVREMGFDRVVYDARGEPVPDNLSQLELDVVRGLRELSSAELDAAVSYIEFMVEKARATRKKEPRCG